MTLSVLEAKLRTVATGPSPALGGSPGQEGRARLLHLLRRGSSLSTQGLDCMTPVSFSEGMSSVCFPTPHSNPVLALPAGNWDPTLGAQSHRTATLDSNPKARSSSVLLTLLFSHSVMSL